jgi:CheY-like chemotaxis protein
MSNSFPNSTQIFIVEDDESTILIIREILKNLGYYRLSSAETGKTAWDELLLCAEAGSPVEVILCDIEMPDGSGFSLIKKVRKSFRLKKTPFMFLTSSTEKTSVQKAVKLGADDYILKPVSKEILAEKLASLWKKTQVNIPKW